MSFDQVVISEAELRQVPTAAAHGSVPEIVHLQREIPSYLAFLIFVAKEHKVTRNKKASDRMSEEENSLPFDERKKYH